MKYLQGFDHVFERTIQQASQELKKFQQEHDATITFDDVLASVEAMRVSLSDLFPALTRCKTIELATTCPLFKSQLRTKKMRIGEITDTRDSATLLDSHLKFLMVYNEESMDLETPNYLLVQRGKGKKGFATALELYYVQGDIRDFFNTLTNLVLVVEHPTKPGCLYKSSNSGEDWHLYRGTSGDTLLFKPHIDWSDIEEMKKQNYNISISFDEK